MIYRDEITSDERAWALARLPEFIRRYRISDIVKIVYVIEPQGSLEQLAKFVIESSTPTLMVNRVFPSSCLRPFIVPSVIAVYPSGAVRTVGNVSRITTERIFFEPFDYWCLLDPDSDVVEFDYTKQLRGHLFAVAIG